MNIQLLLSLIFFALAVAIACLLGLNPLKLLGKVDLPTKPEKKQWERLLRRVGLSKYDLWQRKLRTILYAAGISQGKFALLTLAACSLGVAAGGLLFSSWLVGAFAGLTCSIFPYIFLTLRVQKLERLQEEHLAGMMQTVTNAYIASNDLVKAMETFVVDRNKREGRPLIDPFGEFLAEVTMVNADQTRALLLLQDRVINQYFKDWCKMLIMCAKDGDMKFALYPILASMNDKKSLQEESDNAMQKIWINFLTVVGLSFSIPLMLKLLNQDWYEILVNTLIGKAVLIVMFVYAIIAAILVLRINRPLYR